MKIRAKVSFCGAFSMSPGEIRECSDASLLRDLLRAGYVEEVKAPDTKPVAQAQKTARKRTSRKVKADEVQ